MMRGLSIYLIVGALLLLAADFIAPPVGLGFDVAAWPAMDDGSLMQSVDRTHKGDRLKIHILGGDGLRKIPQKPAKVMIGCDPVFSPLSAARRVNFPARCIAGRHFGHTATG